MRKKVLLTTLFLLPGGFVILAIMVLFASISRTRRIEVIKKILRLSVVLLVVFGLGGCLGPAPSGYYRPTYYRVAPTTGYYQVKSSRPTSQYCTRDKEFASLKLELIELRVRLIALKRILEGVSNAQNVFFEKLTKKK